MLSTRTELLKELKVAKDELSASENQKEIRIDLRKKSKQAKVKGRVKLGMFLLPGILMLIFFWDEFFSSSAAEGLIGWGFASFFCGMVMQIIYYLFIIHFLNNIDNRTWDHVKVGVDSCEEAKREHRSLISNRKRRVDELKEELKMTKEERRKKAMRNQWIEPSHNHTPPVAKEQNGIMNTGVTWGHVAAATAGYYIGKNR